MSSPVTDDTACGIWLYKPKWLQFFASKKAYVLVYGLLGLNELMLIAYFSGTLTTMEKRFQFTSQMSGIIISTWDVFSLMSFLITSHMISRVHRTRWLAIGSMFVGLSCFVRLLPHIIYGPGEEVLQYTVEYGSNVNSTSLLHDVTSQNDKICNGAPFVEDCQNVPMWDMVTYLLLCTAHAMLGLGVSLYWTCGATYLDDNVRKNKAPLMLAIVYSIRMFGPMLGYMLSAYALTKFIDPTLTPIITNKDPRWIGAWWMGWLPIGLSCTVFSTILLLFPRILPREVARRKVLQPEVKKEHISIGFKNSVKRILTNKILLYSAGGDAFFMLGLIGYWNFMPKYMETQFRQTAADSNVASGALGILSSGFGMLISGLVISKFKPSSRTLVTWNFTTKAVEVAGHLAYIFLRCPGDDLHGQWNEDKTWNLTTHCNVACNCGKSMGYNPICSFDKSTTFYSPCFAGCTQTIIDAGVKTYTNCTCIDGLGTAFEGGCPIDCGHSFIIFLVLTGVMQFLTSTSRTGNNIIRFRCVKQEDKPLSTGFAELVMALVTFLPGPVLYGTILDATCIVWSSKCGTEGNCWLYDSKRMNYYLNLTGAGFLLIGTLLDVGVWYHVKGLNIYDNDVENKKSSVDNMKSNAMDVDKRNSSGYNLKKLDNKHVNSSI